MEKEAVIVNKYESIEKCIKRINVIENHLNDLLEFARIILRLKR